MEKKKRGTYKKTKLKMSSERSKNYFKDEHENKGCYVTWADVIDRGGNSMSVLYKIQGEIKQFRTPRWKTVWLDDKGLEQAKFIVEEWKKSNNNSTGKGSLLPDFYLKHRKVYLKWLANTARSSTISNYEADLEQYVFPYMITRLALSSTKQWTQDAISKWDSHISGLILEASSRNRKRTSFNRYLKFLFQHKEIKVLPTLLFESNKRKTKETIIPGDLPQWGDVLIWLKSLPPGRFRFVRAVSMGFGLRISEAISIEIGDFIGDEFKDDLLTRSSFVSKIVEKELGILFLEVTRAEKKKIRSELIKILGEEENDDPKSGPYTACCTSKEIAEFIIELINNGEHEMELTKDQVYKIRNQLATNNTKFKFDQYRPHDDRRLNITLQCLDLCTEINDVVEICCQLHGQSSREVFSRYFQWGQMQRRLQKKGSRQLLTIISKKSDKT